ncbi:hypothetical protein AC249_AIPGENE15639 [Exaiptasia diaphana]|nr:hypothetical protein AC249_AIPGENE15639 [Exaiptasia diaphana]
MPRFCVGLYQKKNKHLKEQLEDKEKTIKDLNAQISEKESEIRAKKAKLQRLNEKTSGQNVDGSTVDTAPDSVQRDSELHVTETLDFEAIIPTAPETPLSSTTIKETPHGSNRSETSRKACISCPKLRQQRETWKRRWRELKVKLLENKQQLNVAELKVLQLEKEIKKLKKSNEELESPQEVQPEEDHELDYIEDSDEEYLDLSGTDMRTERKHIVFLSKLLELFKFCHICKEDDPLVEFGTEVIVYTLSTKAFKTFDHMGLGCISRRTFFKHQKRNQAPSSNGMEFLGFQKCMDFLLQETHVPVAVFVSDRHIQITAHEGQLGTDQALF